MTTATIYHNPRCSKSRQTLQILQDNGITPTIVEYLKDAPDTHTLKTILTQLSLSPTDLMRKKELKDLGLDVANMSEDEQINTLHNHPILIERPIVTTDKGARIGRPPECVMEIL